MANPCLATMFGSAMVAKRGLPPANQHSSRPLRCTLNFEMGHKPKLPRRNIGVCFHLELRTLSIAFGRPALSQVTLGAVVACWDLRELAEPGPGGGPQLGPGLGRSPVTSSAGWRVINRGGALYGRQPAAMFLDGAAGKAGGRRSHGRMRSRGKRGNGSARLRNVRYSPDCYQT